MQNYGFRVVISSRFGDIFRGNSGKAGLLAAQVDEKVVQRLWDLLEDDPGTTVTVDLESRTVRAGEGVTAIEDSFDIDDYTRWRLLEGLDDIGITLVATRPTSRPSRPTRPSYKPVDACELRGLTKSGADFDCGLSASERSEKRVADCGDCLDT